MLVPSLMDRTLCSLSQFKREISWIYSEAPLYATVQGISSEFALLLPPVFLLDIPRREAYEEFVGAECLSSPSFFGAVAQLGARVTGSHEVEGSNPSSSTNTSRELRPSKKSRILEL